MGREKPEFANVKRSNDFLVREALKNYLDTTDAMLILDNLPKEQIEKVVTDKHINDLMNLTLHLLMKRGPGEGPYYVVPIEADAGEKPEVVKVSAADKQRAADLEGIIAGLQAIKFAYKSNSEVFENFETMKKNKMKVGFKRKET